MFKQVSYIYNTKKGNKLFKIGEKTYVILKRNADEIGQNNNYCTEVVLEIEPEKETIRKAKK